MDLTPYKNIPTILADSYCLGHRNQYPKGLKKSYASFTPRGSMSKKYNKTVFFGLQYLIKKYLIEEFDNNFFNRPRNEAVHEYKELAEYHLGNKINCDHIGQLHDLGYLPLKIKSLPEGALVPMGVPCSTITNTHKDFAYLATYIQTIFSCTIWPGCNYALVSYLYRQLYEKYSQETCDNNNHIDFQGHLFSYRGLPSNECAMINGAAHLLSSKGTDSIPSIPFVQHYYNERPEAFSVIASEHSTATSQAQVTSEFDHFLRMLNENPNGIISIISDSYSYFNVLTEFLPKLKEKILSRNGKTVIRPDSGDQLHIVCGDPNGKTEAERKGTLILLDEVFGHTLNSKGYKVLNDKIGCIFGDGFVLDKTEKILEEMKKIGYASSNLVIGQGSWSYFFLDGKVLNRDFHNWGYKLNWIDVNGHPYNIYKDPITDEHSFKKSAKGLLYVGRDSITNEYYLEDQVSWQQESQGELRTVFEDGKLLIDENFSTIRERLNSV